jgi:hypothetical protein
MAMSIRPLRRLIGGLTGLWSGRALTVDPLTALRAE